MRQVSRRNFLKFCTASAVVAGVDPFDMIGLNRAMANPAGPTVLWLQGSGCTGCSISFLNYISPVAPTDAADVLINYINLAYHPNLSPSAGESVAALIQKVRDSGNFILAVEGGVPTKFNGGACYAWSAQGVDVTFAEAVKDLASRASQVLSIGACSAFGGIPAAPPNPTGVVSVASLTGRSTINIAGCPPHPDWIVRVIVQLLQGKAIALDSAGRPTQLFGRTVHSQCPRREREEANTFGIANECLIELGCHGPVTRANCPTNLWNNKINWCIGANGLCLGCTGADFPTNPLFHQHYDD